MYESPINLVFQNIETQMVQEEEQMILEAIRKYDVIVDKEELIKAIKYDRNQYSKGYKDGVNDVLDKIRAEIKEWYWESDKQALAKDPCVIDAMVDLFIRTIDKYKAELDK